MQLRYQLSNLKKKDMPASAYFNRMKGYADAMASAGKPLCDEEILGYILSGLGPEYEPLVTSITNRDTPVTLNHFYAYLLTTKLREPRFGASRFKFFDGGGHGGSDRPHFPQQRQPALAHRRGTREARAAVCRRL